MKNYIVTSTLLAAGTLFASAEGTLTFTTSDGTSDGGNFAGIVFTLKDASTRYSSEGTIADIPLSLNLDSITIESRIKSDGTKYAVTANRYLYITDTDNKLLGVSLTGTQSTDTDYSFSFSGITLSLNQTYYAYFYGGAPSFSVGETVPARQYSSTQIAAIKPFDSGNVTDLGLLSAQGTTIAQTVAPKMSISVSTIPEPSAFGLLAGMGALALVASRRRRK